MSASMLKYLIAADSLCDGENGVSLTALALKAGVTKVSAYRAVDRLETDGYLSRESKKKIVLTWNCTIIILPSCIDLPGVLYLMERLPKISSKMP